MSAVSKKGNETSVCVHTHTHTHTHIYIYICVLIFMQRSDKMSRIKRCAVLE